MQIHMRSQQNERFRAVLTEAARLIMSVVLTLGMAALAQAQPKFTRQPTDQFVDAGKTVGLNFSGNPVGFTNQWFFNGAALADATNASLLFKNAQPSLNGDYFAVIG